MKRWRRWLRRLRQGISTCPACAKEYVGSGDPELCFACWLLEHPPDDTPAPIGKTGAGGWNYYAEPNTIVAVSRADVLDYLAGCPKSRSIWFDVMHNSATPAYNGIGVIRGFQQYHMSKGWSDIGYHWCITPDGTIYLGRNLVHQGAHAFAEGNRGSMGYCLVGDFSGGGGTPTSAQISSAGFLARAHGAAFGYGNHTGHRFVADPSIPSHATSCPGTNVSLAMVRQWTSGAPAPAEEDEMAFAINSSGPDPVKLWLTSAKIGGLRKGITELRVDNRGDETLHLLVQIQVKSSGDYGEKKRKIDPSKPHQSSLDVFDLGATFNNANAGDVEVLLTGDQPFVAELWQEIT